MIANKSTFVLFLNSICMHDYHLWIQCMYMHCKSSMYSVHVYIIMATYTTTLSIKKVYDKINIHVPNSSELLKKRNF